ncbi:putative yir3 protein [Plasmodium yoelii yoelii]|uniref:Yir3 protein n=1 Tax=Plasmodium yoelii yoelii TaxID=73239 RepID=Q7RD09_PLAYO|nr:putative yir3 protein [Plasmodium yoelii yoelii]
MVSKVVYIFFLILFCESINKIDNYFDDDPKKPRESNSMDLLKLYCPNNNCNSDEEKIISGFIMLLIFLDGIDEKNLKNDKLVEYAILWLSYKLTQKTENGTTKLDDFYTKHIKENSCYKGNVAINTADGNKIYMDVINAKIKSMNMDIKDISNFYDALKSLCNMYSELDVQKNQCKKCLENAGEFFEKYEKLNNVSNITKESPYYQLLSSLSNDYDIFKKKYNDVGCNNFSLIVACPRSSVTKNTLITIAIIFVASSILLGVSYKVNNELKIFFHYIYANINIKIIRFLTFYISIRYLDFGNDLKNNI